MRALGIVSAVLLCLACQSSARQATSAPIKKEPLLHIPAECRTDEQTVASRGLRVLSGFDFNGDGFSDFALRVETSDVSIHFSIFLGSTLGINAISHSIVVPALATRILDFDANHEVSIKDINSDGRDDLVLTWLDRAGETRSRVRLAYLGTSTGIRSSPPTSVVLTEQERPTATRDRWLVDDFNGDGHNDRFKNVLHASVLGVSFRRAPTQSGAVLELGGATGLQPAAGQPILHSCRLATPNFPEGVDRATQPQHVDVIGSCHGAVPIPNCRNQPYWNPLRSGPWSPAGEDVNGDGRADLVVRVQVATQSRGAPPLSSGNLFEPFIFVYRGSPDGVASDPLSRIPGSGSPIGIGDANGDGFGEAVMIERQAALVLYGGLDGLSTARSTFLPAPTWHHNPEPTGPDEGGSTLILFEDHSPSKDGRSGRIIGFVHDPDSMVDVASSLPELALPQIQRDPYEYGIE